MTNMLLIAIQMRATPRLSPLLVSKNIYTQRKKAPVTLSDFKGPWP